MWGPTCEGIRFFVGFHWWNVPGPVFVSLPQNPTDHSERVCWSESRMQTHNGNNFFCSLLAHGPAFFIRKVVVLICHSSVPAEVGIIQGVFNGVGT